MKQLHCIMTKGKLTKSVSVNLRKRLEGKAKSVVGTGKTDIAKKRGHHLVVIIFSIQTTGIKM